MEKEEDIVERLRRNDLSDNASGVPCVLCLEAADEIELQAEKVFYASIERSKLETALKVANDLLRETRESLADAQAEIERLRAEHAEDVHSNLKLHDEIKRLRAQMSSYVEGWHNKHDPSTLVERAKVMSGIDGDTHLCWEAADEIERLREENFNLHAMNDRQAETIERLRAKLREIATCEHCEGGDHVTLADIGQGLVSSKLDEMQVLGQQWEKD